MICSHKGQRGKRGTIPAPVSIGLLALGALLATNPTLAQEIPVPTPRPKFDAPVESVQEPSQTPHSETSVEARMGVPPVIHQIACPALRTGQVRGKLLAPVHDGACGSDSPLQIEAVSEVKLTGEPLSTCAMAEGLAAMSEAAKKAAQDILGTELAAIVTGPGYECRRRNRAATGKLSEHAFANALDIAGFKLADGRQVTVEADWPHLPPAEPLAEPAAEGEEAPTNDEAKPAPASERAATPEAKFLVAVRDAACGIFTTVLSPDSNTAHHAHLHFDLGCHGRDCTYLICE